MQCVRRYRIKSASKAGEANSQCSQIPQCWNASKPLLTQTTRGRTLAYAAASTLLGTTDINSIPTAPTTWMRTASARCASCSRQTTRHRPKKNRRGELEAQEATTQSPRAKASGTRKSARQMRKRERQWDKRIGVTRGINRSPARITVQPNPRLRPSLPGPAYLHYPPPRRLSPSPSYPHPSYPHPSYPHPFYTHPSYPHPSPTPISTQVTETTLPEPPFPTGTPSPHRNPPHPPLNLPHPT